MPWMHAEGASELQNNSYYTDTDSLGSLESSLRYYYSHMLKRFEKQGLILFT